MSGKMIGIGTVLLVFVVGACLSPAAYAALWGQDKAAAEAPQAAAAQQAETKAPAAPAPDKAAEAKKKKLKEAEEKLTKTVWEIDITEVIPSGNGKTFTDTLRFKEGRVISDWLVPDGFTGSNYSLRVKGEKTLIWETMQSSEKNGIAFWRGDLTTDVTGPMRGAISRHIDDKTVKDYVFVSTKKDALPDEAPPPAPEPAAEAAAVLDAEKAARETAAEKAVEAAPAPQPEPAVDETAVDEDA